jgi:parvulin-like peptidyl-prolyl isomerase
MTITETQSIMTEADYQQTYTNFKNNILQEIGFSEEDFRKTVEADLLRTKVQDVVTQDISQEAEQVEVTYIASPTEEEALVLQERILAGESIEDLIEILNSNETEQSFGRTLPWYPQRYLSNLLGPELAELAFELSIGEISEPLPGQGGELTYLIYVNGREVRPLDEALLQQEKQEAFNTWLQNQKDERVEYLDWESVTPDEP